MAIALTAGEVEQFLGDFGEAWVEAVCLAGGFTPNRQDHDRRGFDFTVSDDSSELVRVQVKTTENPNFSASSLKIALDVPTYNRLREGTTAGHLVGVVVHQTYPGWILQGNRKALVRVQGYWVNLAGMPATANTTSITIDLPLSNAFQPETVGKLFL